MVTPTKIALTSSLALLTLAAAGCVDDPELGTSAEMVIGGDGEPCPKLGCGSNSAFLGPTEFHELDETGQVPNDEGFRLAAFRKNNVNYKLEVNGTTLVGKSFLFGQWITTLADADLVGSEMMIVGDNVAYIIKVFSASTTQKFWQGPAGNVNTYELQWRRLYPSSTDWVHVCNDPPNRIDGEGKEWMHVDEAILFDGNRYDADALTVEANGPRPSGTWFNIGCSGTVLAKLALNRHTYATAVPGAATTTAQQQAMLKMYTADVCGTGDAFTQTGTPLRWWSTNGWIGLPVPYNSFEARWDENGATCLTTHRLHGTFDDMDSQIDAACASVNKVLQPCAAFPPPYYLRTASQAIP